MFQEMMFLSDEKVGLICDNIITINKTGTRQLQIETHVDGKAEY